MDAARQFKAFEFKKGLDMAVAGEEFLEEFGSFLHVHRLGDVIGISMLPPGKEHWVETVLGDGKGTVARRGQASSGVVKEWAFFVHDGALDYKEIRKCNTSPEGGSHVRS